MLLNFLVLLGGLIVLVVAADKFVTGTASIARHFGIPPLLIGLTIVGLGTSAPEILVSVIASLQGNAGLAVGNALGSNIANLGLILGCTALVSPLAFRSHLLKCELPILMTISLICYFLSFDGLDRLDGVVMLLMLLLFMLWLVRSARQHQQAADPLKEELLAEVPETLSAVKAGLFFFIGLAGLLISSRIIVWAAVNIAASFGVSDLIIGLTIVALGTSLPELAASIGSVLKKQHDLAVGNVIGSNVYNLLAVYSMPGLIAPGAVAESVVIRDFPVMLGLTAVLFIMGYGKNNPGLINRIEGGGLLLAFCAYQWFLYQSTMG